MTTHQRGTTIVGSARTLAALAATAALLAACGGGGGGKELSGIFTLSDDEISGGWNDCSGTGGYVDFGAGMNVTVRDGAGEIVGTGSTRNLTSADIPEGYDDMSDEEKDELSTLASAAVFADVLEDSFCIVVFEDLEIRSADFYEIEVGRRGGLSYSADELKERDYFVELSLGG